MKNILREIFIFVYWSSRKHPTADGSIYTISNLWVILLKSGIISLTDGQRISFNRSNKQEVFNLVRFALHSGIRFGNEPYQWKLDQENGVIETHQGVRFKIKNVDILDETFLNQIHFSGFDLADKVVITAGAYIGDTPLFYSFYKAKVIAFEPDQKSFEIAKENISLNPNLAVRISLTNYAVGRDGIVEFPVNDDSGASSIYGEKIAKTIKIRSVSISTILKEFNIVSPYLLDIDIKGAEFEVIEDPSLSKFSKIRIEYSPYFLNGPNKSLNYIIQKLNSYGFNKVRVWKHSSIRFDLLNHGTIDAEK